MASIKINNLNPAGSELFDESEELGIQGGMWPYIAGVASVIAVSAMFSC